MEVDYELIGEGFLLSNKYFSMMLDGTFHSLGDEELQSSHKSLVSMPNYKKEFGPIQLYISEYTAKTFIKAAAAIDRLTIDTKVNAKVIQALLPEFKSAFGSDFDKVKLIGRPSGEV